MIEAKLDKGRGPVATVLVNRGTLKVGDIFVVGAESGKVRALVDDKGRQIKEAGPSMPVEVLGLSGVPTAGDPLQVVENEARAREVAAYRAGVIQTSAPRHAPASLESMFSALKEKQAIEYPLVVKADTQGHGRGDRRRDQQDHRPMTIKARVLHSGVGGITESDVTLAAASGAPIIGFNVRANAKAREIAERQKVAFKYYDVIYELTDEIRAGMAGELGPEAFETVVGRAEIREVFSAGKHGKAAGLLVTEGIIRKALKARITRDDVIIYQGEIASLRRFKDDVAEVRAGLECGVTFTQNFIDIKAGRLPRDLRGRDARTDAVILSPPARWWPGRADRNLTMKHTETSPRNPLRPPAARRRAGAPHPVATSSRAATCMTRRWPSTSSRSPKCACRPTCATRRCS